MTEYKTKRVLTGDYRSEKIYNVKVYIAETGDFGLPLYPEERRKEISECKSAKVRREKSSVWALLEYAVKDAYGKKLCDFVFEKTSDGKWVSDKFYFSLSHSKNVVTVAVSDCPIGVDVESIDNFSVATERNKDKFLKKICSEDEYEKYKNAPISLLTALWTQKESTYKMEGRGPCLFKNDIEHDKITTIGMRFNGEYVVSVCADEGASRVFYIVE